MAGKTNRARPRLGSGTRQKEPELRIRLDLGRLEQEAFGLGHTGGRSVFPTSHCGLVTQRPGHGGQNHTATQQEARRPEAHRNGNLWNAYVPDLDAQDFPGVGSFSER